MISLIGKNTRYLYKFVRWELEQSISLGLPIIGVNLNKERSQDPSLCPPVIRDELVVYVSYNTAIIQYALENWPTGFTRLRREGTKGPRYYKQEVYRDLAL